MQRADDCAFRSQFTMLFLPSFDPIALLPPVSMPLRFSVSLISFSSSHLDRTSMMGILLLQ